MGKKDKKKKKGKGVEKTQVKTEKKLITKMKKELKDLGEDDIESMIAQIEKEEQKLLQVTEIEVEPPSRRVNFSLVSHPDKDQLILYGGEYFNGQKTFVYNDLYFYNIPTNKWISVKASAGPPPRCSHQMVATSANKGQLWLFGGEFASPSQSQFYHYRDLWVYHLFSKQWEKITAPNAPSARSGHRMVLIKKQLFLFGGFHDNLRDCKYFNDLYSFDLETYKWKKIEPVGTPPAGRSACCMMPLPDGKILIYGGYSKDCVKKDIEKGHVYTDAFIVGPDKHDPTETKFKWQHVKLGNQHFPPRCGMSVTTTDNGLSAYCFGGVFDHEDDEGIYGNFFNDFLQLDLEKMAWRQIELRIKRDVNAKRRKNKDEELPPDETLEIMDVQEIADSVKSTTISDDGVFKVTVGPAVLNQSSTSDAIHAGTSKPFQPSHRSNCGLTVKHGILYLYGGTFEYSKRDVTYHDLYSIDLRKLDEWKVLIEDDASKVEWFGSDSESEEEDEEEESDSDSDMEDN
ncbi:kelch domain-containing protein 4 [Euwallacea fornicatus]|uniref:kelch domain-containing protein 4 n=1 Tax=Euwallacea fornicatus TaxID=995702 RepID=UPI00338FE374